MEGDGFDVRKKLYATGSGTVGRSPMSVRQGQDQRELLEPSSGRCYETSTRPDVGLNPRKTLRNIRLILKYYRSDFAGFHNMTNLEPASMRNFYI